MLLLRRDALGALRAHAEAEAPREACGLLLGREAGPVRTVEVARPARNLAAARDAFDLAPDDLLAADAEARAAGLEILGVYHSHPGGTVRPSARDREAAEPGWSVLIVAVGTEGPAPRVRGEAAWRPVGPPGAVVLEPEPLEVAPPTRAGHH